VNVCDWREAGPEVLAPLYAQGQRRWLSALGWDTASSCGILEHARTTQGLPGLLAVDDAGQVRGWTFFHLQDNVLHVGGLAAETAVATRALVGAIVELGEDSGAVTVSCFVFDEAPGLAEAIEHAGFGIEPFIYLARDIVPGPLRGPRWVRAWEPQDIDGAAELLSEAYVPGSATYLVPNHTPAAWQRYVRNLVEQTGLGTLNPPATRVLPGEAHRPPGSTAEDPIDGLVVVTALSAATAHLAQVAVRPSRRGKGTARDLVDDACRLAAGQGYSRATLLVGATNRTARRLYANLGFTPGGRFIGARRTRVGLNNASWAGSGGSMLVMPRARQT
jgi:ribosomal protein S18 acetylase RimI-like enzyme